MTQNKLAHARPTLMIEVALAGTQGTQIYPLNVARELHSELGLALAAIDAPEVDPSEDPELPEADDGIPDDEQSPIPDDPKPEALDEPDPVEDGLPDPDA